MINEKEFNQDILDLLIKYGYNGEGVQRVNINIEVDSIPKLEIKYNITKNER